MVLRVVGIFLICVLLGEKQAGMHLCMCQGVPFKQNNHYSEKDFLSFLFCVKKANLVNYFHLVHKVIILMLFTSMLKICSLVKMKVTLISPKSIFFPLRYIA